MIKSVPMALVALRFLLALAIITLCAVFGAEVALLVWLMIGAGLLSDIFDGIIARAHGVATPTLRRLDSQCDIIFWVLSYLGGWLAFPTAFDGYLVYFLIFGAAQAAIYATSFIRFGREHCTHTYLAKFFGLLLFANLTELFLFGSLDATFHVLFAVGIVSQVEILWILLTLPSWRHDVGSILFLLRERR